MDIGKTLSRAIKEGKWAWISYDNKSGENTSYWIAVKDINLKTKKLKVVMYNNALSNESIETYISFEGIKDAKVIEFSSYDSNSDLIEKLEQHPKESEWLGYDSYNHSVLNYYEECNALNVDPCQSDYAPIKGIDLSILKKDKTYRLSEEQMNQLVRDIYYNDINKVNSFNQLAINVFSISSNGKKYVVCYYDVSFDPEKKSLVLGKEVRFNSSFMVDGKKHSIFRYINMDPDVFAETFQANYNEYKAMINENLRLGETIDTRPDFMILSRDYNNQLPRIYASIEQKYQNNELPTPMKAFFGNMTKRYNVRRKEPTIILRDKNINIDQMRVIYNALKFPVTYVQGPPGNGKTQTLINVVLSAFYSGKKTLVCSNNNKPIDGIIEKLNFKYNGEKVEFPYLRLGNRDEVLKATERITRLAKMSTTRQPLEDKLHKIAVSNDEGNKELVSLLNTQEKIVELETEIGEIDTLLKNTEDKNGAFAKNLYVQRDKMRESLNEMPYIDNDKLLSLFTSITESWQLQQYLYYKSLQYLLKLKEPRYQKLLEICRDSDEAMRVTNFNAWLSKDENMKLLNAVFPIVFSTNISSARLGSPDYMFDLVCMDEAGQCDPANALIPISKAESLLLTGDNNQLQPVIILEDSVNKKLMKKYNVPEGYDYKHNSILTVMRSADRISKDILLKYHYRCGRRISKYASERFYDGKLDLSYIKNEGHLQFVDIKNNNTGLRNEAFDEVLATVDYISRNSIKDAYIVTPFRNQADLMNNELRRRGIEGVDCGTIHKMQGGEKNTVIFSLAISPKTSKRTYEWLESNDEMINVAVTRAKENLIIIGDGEAVDKLSEPGDNVSSLINYVKNYGNVDVAPKQPKVEIGRSNGSMSENEFFKTISMFCSAHNSFSAKRNVPVKNVLSEYDVTSDSKQEFDLVMYDRSFLQGKKARIVFEVNGGEHYGNSQREKNDRRKMQLCKKLGIKLMFIPNSMVKDYEYIALLLMSLTEKKDVQTTLFE